MTDTDPTPERPRRPASGPVQYRGEDLDAERGPGLGCFRFQLIVLVALLVLTPLSVAWEWPSWLSAALLIAVIVLLLVAGQTIIFLLRLVAADRRGRRRPLASGTRTVGELEDESTTTDEPATTETATTETARTDEPATTEPPTPETPPDPDRPYTA